MIRKNLSLKIVGWCCFFGFALGCSDNGITPMLRPLPDQKVEEVVQENLNTQKVRMPRVEILFVIDDSGSMVTHQKNLRKNMGLFISALAQDMTLDYRIGVTTTSESDKGVLKQAQGFHSRYVTRATPGGLNILAEMVMVGTNGDVREKMLSQIIPVLKNPFFNFYRPGAHFAVVFVTDAEDQSQLDPQLVYNELLNITGGHPERLLAYGVIVPPGVRDVDCPRDEGRDPLLLVEFINLVNSQEKETEAKYFNLCSPRFGSKLAGIAEGILEKVGNRILLYQVPDPETIKVTYGEVSLPNHPDKGWTYDPKNKSIYLGREVVWPEDDIERDLKVSFERAIFPEEREHAKK